MIALCRYMVCIEPRRSIVRRVAGYKSPVKESLASRAVWIRATLGSAEVEGISICEALSRLRAVLVRTRQVAARLHLGSIAIAPDSCAFASHSFVFARFSVAFA